VKALFVKYKSVIQFILTFLMVYFVLTLSYKLYLDNSEGLAYYPDYLTYQVAEQTNALLDAFGYETDTFPHPDEASIQLIVNDYYVARIIEGCNSVSIIILFVSFIIAFSGGLKATLVYLLVGGFLIYIVNLARIALLAVGLYQYPEHSGFLHSVVFPGIIYGMVFLLWMFWVNRFSTINKQHKKEILNTTDEL